MHKLGTELGVKGMSLYKHVTNKDDLLDGMVDRLWAEVPSPTELDDWKVSVCDLAESLRWMVLRHPRTASLLTSRSVLAVPGLKVADEYIHRLTASGVPGECVISLLQTVIGYSLGSALLERTIPDAEPDEDEIARFQRVIRELPPGTPEPLVRTALLLCGDRDADVQFRTGVDLMVRGLDSYLREGLLPGQGRDTQG